MFKLQNTVYPWKEECRKNKNKHEVSGKIMKYYTTSIYKSKAPKNDWTEYKKLILKYAEDTITNPRHIQARKDTTGNKVIYAWSIPEFDSVGLRIQKAEKLLKDIKNTGSHHQIKDKIDNYFKELDYVKRSP